MKEISAVRLFWAIIGALATGAGIFGLGFALGDKWSGIKRDDLARTIETQDRTIDALNEKVQLLGKSRPELENLIESIREEKIVVLASGITKTEYKYAGSLYLKPNQTERWQNIIFFTNNGSYNNIGIDYYRIHVAGFEIEDKEIELKIGQSILFLLNGEKRFAVPVKYSKEYGLELQIFREK